jgi:hypothetical protein
MFGEARFLVGTLVYKTVLPFDGIAVYIRRCIE